MLIAAPFMKVLKGVRPAAVHYTFVYDTQVPNCAPYTSYITVRSIDNEQ
jgi:hypothetical protein